MLPQTFCVILVQVCSAGCQFNCVSSWQNWEMMRVSDALTALEHASSHERTASLYGGQGRGDRDNEVGYHRGKGVARYDQPNLDFRCVTSDILGVLDGVGGQHDNWRRLKTVQAIQSVLDSQTEILNETTYGVLLSVIVRNRRAMCHSR
jgi:hypothetical protein